MYIGDSYKWDSLKFILGWFYFQIGLESLVKKECARVVENGNERKLMIFEVVVIQILLIVLVCN